MWSRILNVAGISLISPGGLAFVAGCAFRTTYYMPKLFPSIRLVPLALSCPSLKLRVVANSGTSKT